MECGWVGWAGISDIYWWPQDVHLFWFITITSALPLEIRCSNSFIVIMITIFERLEHHKKYNNQIEKRIWNSSFPTFPCCESWNRERRAAKEEKLLKNHNIKKCFTMKRDMLCVRRTTGAYHIWRNEIFYSCQAPLSLREFFCCARFYVVFWSLPHDFNGGGRVWVWMGFFAAAIWWLEDFRMCGMFIYSLLVDMQQQWNQRIAEGFLFFADQFFYSNII